LVADGLSGGQIGAALGISRNAVIGKVHRLGLSLHGKCSEGAGIKQTRPASPRRHSLPAPADNSGFYAIASAKPVQPPPPSGLTLFDLRSDTCRWPLNDGRPEFYFCGEPPAPNSPYCAEHTAVAFSPASTRWRG